MITELILGQYEIDNSQPLEIQHTLKIQAILAEGIFSLALGRLLKDTDIEVKLKILKDELWPGTGGFGLSDKFAVIAEIEDGNP